MRSARRTSPTIWAERSLNNEIGLPLTVCRLEPETRGARHRDGHARARPDRSALRDRATDPSSSCPHIGPEHLELLGTRRARGRGERRGDRVAAGQAALRSCPAQRGRARSVPRPQRHRRSAASTRRTSTRENGVTRFRSATTVSRARAPVHAAPSRGEHARRAARATTRSVSRSSAPPRGSPESELSPWRGEELAAPGRRLRRQRRVQREPRLDARGARAPRGARGRQPEDRDPRGDGRARRAELRGLPPRDRRARRRARDRGHRSGGGRARVRARRVGRGRGGRGRRRPRAASTRATPSSSRRPGPSGSKASPTRSRTSPEHGPRPDRGPDRDGRRRRDRAEVHRRCSGHAISGSRSGRRDPRPTS